MEKSNYHCKWRRNGGSKIGKEKEHVSIKEEAWRKVNINKGNNG